MKRNLSIGLVFSAFLVLVSCNGLDKMAETNIDYSATPEVLEMHAGEVSVKISATYPEKYFPKKATATITPTLVYEGGEKALKPVFLQGEKVEGNATVISSTGGSISYEDKFVYTPEMRRSKLELRIVANQKKKSITLDPIVIAEGIVATPDLVIMLGVGSNAKDKFVKDVPASHMGQINYEKNRADLRSSERRKDEIKELKAFVDSAVANDRQELKNVELTSYASPEGTLERNTKVSNDRSKTVDKFVKNEFKKIEEFKNDDFFKYLVTEEDWSGFKKAVSESKLADKDMILRVVNMNSDPDKREAEIRNMTATFKELEEYIHPLLRRSEIKVNIMLIGNTDEEIAALFSSNPSKLTVEELLYFGSKSEKLDDKLAIYSKTTELYPKEWRGFNNLAVAEYKKGNIAAAKTAIEKAKSLEANATVLNNLGNVNLAEGEIELATVNFQSATGVKEASYGQGTIAIKNAEYKTAAEYFGSYGSFNAALANLLNGNYDAAIKAADSGEDKDSAMNFYIKAIAGARKSDSDILFNNLRTACTKDPALKPIAAKDVEFIKYFDNDTFKTIVQ